VEGLRRYWRDDLIAGFSVALVALPLALGIATAADAPPISGLVSVVVAGVVATFLRGSHIAINGPGNSLIVIIAAGFTVLGDGPGAFSHILGAVVVAGALQVGLGLFRLGKLGDLIPAAVVQGLLSAIGLIIVGKQAHVVFGGTSAHGSPIEVFQGLPETVAALNPLATFIGLVSLAILIIHPRIKAKVVRYVPAPLWVVIVSAPIALLFTRYHTEVVSPLGLDGLDTSLLVAIPDDLLGSLVHPDFSRIDDPAFWVVVLTLTLVTSLENVVSVKAVDKLDPHRRRSGLDRDLVAMGLCSIAAGMLGGLPVLTVIARSSVNVNHGAKTGWSNFFHGLIVLAFVVLLAPAIEEIALSALAAILVYTGYKLAAPHVLRDTIHKGPDHFIVFGITIVATMVWGLLWGIIVGFLAEMMGHFLIVGLPPREAWRLLRATRIEVKHDGDGPHLLRIEGVANCLAIPRLRQAYAEVPKGESLVLDFHSATLVDTTFLEYCHELRRRQLMAFKTTSFELIGLEAHTAISDHPDALHAQQRQKLERRWTERQREIARIADEHEWHFEKRRVWDHEHLDYFDFFRVHPIEYRDTVVKGAYEIGDDDVEFMLCDVTFDEGALIPEVYHTTVQVLHLPFEIPELVMEKEGLLERALELAGVHDIDFRENPGFSRKYALKGPNEEAIRKFMSPALLEFFEQEPVYHLESNGDEIVVFKTLMRRATVAEIEAMLDFSERLARLLIGVPAETTAEVDELDAATRPNAPSGETSELGSAAVE
jgi:MFS superfamily sulfate permease-like transporter